MFTRKIIFGMMLAVLAAMTGPALGLVYYQVEYEENNGPPTNLETPYEQCMARVNKSASQKPSVAIIAPNFIMTAAHWVYPSQDASPFFGKKISVGAEGNDDYIIVDGRVGEKSPTGGYTPDLGVYRVKKLEWIDPNDPNEPNNITDPNDYDKLKDADFSNWLDLYSNSDEVGKLITIGGYGPQRVIEDCNLSEPLWKWPKRVPAGTLHWGRNVVSSGDEAEIVKIFSPIGEGDYVKYEVFSGDGDSGSPWFIKDGIEWKQAGLNCGVNVFYKYTAGPRISQNIDWIDEQIEDMNGTRPPADLADIHWEGTVDGDWFDANNWEENTVPTSDDRAGIDSNSSPDVVISSGQAAAKEIFVGIDVEGNLSQSGGTVTVEEYLYIGGRTDCNGTYTISGGTLSAKGIAVGGNGIGELDVNDPNVEILTENLLLGENSVLEVEPNSVIQFILTDDQHGNQTVDGKLDLDGRIHIEEDANGTDLAGLGNLTVVCSFIDSNEYDPNINIVIEAAGIDKDSITISDFNSNNFTLNKLVVGLDVNDVNASAGSVCVEMTNSRGNQEEGVVDAEALYLNTLELEAGATFELDPDTGNPLFNVYYKNGGSPKQFFMGDVDLDGDVDQNDLDIWSPIGSGAQWSDGDMDGDRDVDLDDKDIIENAMKTAKAPWPPNGSTVLSPITQLTWVGAVDADSHDVYFGTSYNDVNDANESSPEFKGNQEGTSYEPDDTMGRVKTFYWRIDEVDVNNDANKGYVWVFTYAPKNCVKNVTKSVYYDFIQDAIKDANDGDVIELAEETFYESIIYNVKAITIRSKEPNDWDVVEKTIIEDSGVVVTFSNGTDCNTILAGVTVRNGTTGIYFNSPSEVSSGTVTNCIITNNDTGVFCWSGSSVITNNIIFQGGIGIFCYDTDATVIKNNLIYDCSYHGSTDAGIYFVEANSIGIVKNNTIVGNDQGILVDGGTAPTISNCILWYNDDNLAGCNTTFSCIEDCNEAGGVGNICGDANDPMFVDPNNDDYHLDTNSSPCFDAGDPNYELEDGETDIDGDDRVMNGRVDMGADELACLSRYDTYYDNWIYWGKPECWCYQRQCRGDTDGQKEGTYWVSDYDWDKFAECYNKFEYELPDGCECADFDHQKAGPFWVGIPDLNIIREYFEETEPNVPTCEDCVKVNFWTN